MPKKTRKISIIGLIIIVFVAKEFAWACLVPRFQSHDELAHYRYIQTLFNERKLPALGQTLGRDLSLPASGYGKIASYNRTDDTITPTGPLEPAPGYGVNWIAHQPPIYYFILLPVYGFLQNQNVTFILMVMRMISILMAAATLFVIFKTMQKLLPEKRVLQTAVTCGVAFLSTFSFISALVNNDNLANLLSAILIYLLVTRNESQQTAVKWSIETGIVMAMLALTKIHLLSLFFVVLIVQIIDLFKAKEPAKRKSVMYSILIVFAIPLVLAGWWYLRNYMMFGTFFATLRDAVVINPQIVKYFPDILQKFPDINPYATMKLGLVKFFITNNFLFEFYKNIWGSWKGRGPDGHFELMTIWQYIGIFAFTIIGVIGQIKNMYLRRIFNGNPFKRFSDFLASGRGILFSAAILLLAILTWQIYKMSSLVGALYAYHGRYFMAAAPALMYMLLRGWEHLIGKKWFEKAAIALIVLFILNDAFSLIYMFIPFFCYYNI